MFLLFVTKVQVFNKEKGRENDMGVVNYHEPSEVPLECNVWVIANVITSLTHGFI